MYNEGTEIYSSPSRLLKDASGENAICVLKLFARCLQDKKRGYLTRITELV